MRRYDDPVEVRKGPEEDPEQFLWRGKLWKVRAVLAHWVETGAWWQSAGARAAIGSDDVDFAPTDVYCKVGGGELRHLIAKTDDRPQLLEVTPGEFAMLKLQKKGAPEKNTDPSGIEYRIDGVVFTDAAIGNATLNGALECTEVENN